MSYLPSNPDELLLRLVGADEKARPDRERFILFRVMGSGAGLPIGHPGLDEDGLSAREQDLEDLAESGFLRLKVRDKAWHFDITQQGFEHARKLRLASESQPLSAGGGGLDWEADVRPILLAVGQAYPGAGRLPNRGVSLPRGAHPMGAPQRGNHGRQSRSCSRDDG